MSELLAAAKEVCDWLDSQGFRSCIIGGLAVQRWGEPRLTRDVDLIVHKSVAARPQDVADIHGIVHRQRANPDLGHVRHWLEILAEIKDDPNVGRPFEESLAAATTAANRKAPR